MNPGRAMRHHAGMFERIKKTVGDAIADYKVIASTPGPADLAAVPPLPAGSPDGLSSLDPAVVSAYVGLAVASIGPMGRFGPEATGFIGMQIQQRLRAAGGGQLAEGYSERRDERLRARGLSEEQIRAVNDQIAEAQAGARHNAWTVDFADGTHASVQILDPADQQCRFEAFRTHYRRQHTNQGAKELHDNLLESRVQQVMGAPYECYVADGALAARGRDHEALVKSAHLKTVHVNEAMAALAVLGLRVVEG